MSDSRSVKKKRVCFTCSSSSVSPLWVQSDAGEPRAVPVHNPHLRQICADSVPLLDESSLQRTLSPDSPRLIYRRRRGEVKSLVHWGQRKLLISEVEFLTEYARNDSQKQICVYAGAAPGYHITYLSELFPNLTFILIDPRNFRCENIRGSIEIRQELMTDSIAETFREKEVLFISDIRSAEWSCVGNSVLESEIAQDMNMQMRWHLIMKPAASMLKFRLPWTEGVTRYLDGKLFLPVWGPPTTTECRLVVTTHHEQRDYDHRQHWEQMFYFNTVARPSAYHHEYAGVDWLDCCYDCAVEGKVLKEYICSRRISGSVVDVSAEVHKMIQKSTAACTTTLCAYQYKTRLSPSNDDCDTMYDQVLPTAFSSSGRKVSRVSTEYNARHITLVNTIDLLRRCYEDSHNLKGADNCKADGSTTNWIHMIEPDMLDLPVSDVGTLSPLGIGFEVPPDCALDIWLWSSLRELGRAVGVASYDLDTSPDRLFSPSAIPEISMAIVSAAIKQETFEIFARQLDVHFKRESISNEVPILLMFCSSGRGYLFFTDASSSRREMDQLIPMVSMVQLPCSEYQHLTLCGGYFCSGATCDIYLSCAFAVNGVSTISEAERSRCFLEEFIKTNLNFDTAARAHILNTIGLNSIKLW